MASRIANVTSWFSTKSQKWISFVLCSSTISSTILYYAPHTILIDQYQSLFEMHRNKEPVAVDEYILCKFNEVLTDVKKHLPARAKLKPFITFAFDPFNAGYTNSAQGSIVGIPFTFSYTNINDVDMNPILVEGKTVDSKHTASKQLKSSVLLSDNAKKYAISREVLFSNTHHLFYQVMYPPLLCMSLNYVSHVTKKKLGLSQQPPLIRGIFYTFLTVFGFVLWFTLKDNTNLYFEKLVEDQICALGSDYVQGGLEYYTKRLERNKALRELMGQGYSLYTVTGNENIFFRNKTLPLTAKLKFFEAKLLEQESENYI